MFFNGGFYVGFILTGNEHRERERDKKMCPKFSEVSILS